MKAKILLLILSLFLASMQFFGQGINGILSTKFKTSASVTGNLTIDKNIQETKTQTDIKSAAEIVESLRLKLTCDANSYSDEAIIIFNNSDPSQGAAKFMSMYSSAPELWSVKNGLKYSISFLGGLDSTVIVPISVKAGIPGNYTITASQLESFGSNTEIFLEDRATETLIGLVNTPAYTFQVKEMATIADRFFLHFIDKTSTPPKDLTAITDKEAAQNFKIYSNDGTIIIASLQQQSGKITIFDINGRRIAIDRVNAKENTQIDMNGKTGVYIVSVLSSKGTSNTKILVR